MRPYGKLSKLSTRTVLARIGLRHVQQGAFELFAGSVVLFDVFGFGVFAGEGGNETEAINNCCENVEQAFELFEFVDWLIGAEDDGVAAGRNAVFDWKVFAGFDESQIAYFAVHDQIADFAVSEEVCDFTRVCSLNQEAMIEFGITKLDVLHSERFSDLVNAFFGANVEYEMFARCVNHRCARACALRLALERIRCQCDVGIRAFHRDLHRNDGIAVFLGIANYFAAFAVGKIAPDVFPAKNIRVKFHAKPRKSYYSPVLQVYKNPADIA